MVSFSYLLEKSIFEPGSWLESWQVCASVPLSGVGIATDGAFGEASVSGQAGETSD